MGGARKLISKTLPEAVVIKRFLNTLGLDCDLCHGMVLAPFWCLVTTSKGPSRGRSTQWQPTHEAASCDRMSQEELPVGVSCSRHRLEAERTFGKKGSGSSIKAEDLGISDYHIKGTRTIIWP